MSEAKQYDKSYKEQAVKLAGQIGTKKASDELKVPYGTLYGWVQATKKGDSDMEERTPENVMSLAEEVRQLRSEVKRLNKENKRLQEERDFLNEAAAFFCSEPSEVSKKERMKFIALKTNDGQEKGRISFYCRVLEVTRQGFRDYLENRDKPWKHEGLAAKMMEMIAEDEWNDTYGRERMHQALTLKYPEADIPSESTIYRVMRDIGITHKPNHKPNGITKADKEARKSDDLLKRDFCSEKPCKKCVTDITEIKAKNGKLYVSAIFDCFDVSVLGLAMDDNMRAELCVQTVDNAVLAYPELSGAILHSDRGNQYTSELFRQELKATNLKQSMNSAGGRCHDNARCESMWARMKWELFYSRGLKSEDYTIEQLKFMIWRYFMCYWNNRRICSGNNGLPPAEKRRSYYAALSQIA